MRMIDRPGRAHIFCGIFVLGCAHITAVYYKYTHHHGGTQMSLDIWYELRVEGSAGTRTGIASGTTEGIAIAHLSLIHI